MDILLLLLLPFFFWILSYVSRTQRLDLNDINDPRTIERVCGMGSGFAQAILDKRAEKPNGRFNSMEELREICGIGSRRLSALKSKFYVEKQPNHADVHINRKVKTTPKKNKSLRCSY